MSRYRIATFARYAELLGSTSLEIELPDPTTIASLLAALRHLPGGEALPPRPLLAINHALSPADGPISPGDELALLPPLAGG